MIGRVAARFELGRLVRAPAVTPRPGWTAGRSIVIVPAQPSVFAGWVAGHGGWPDYNATHRHDTALGARARMDALPAALP